MGKRDELMKAGGANILSSMGVGQGGGLPAGLDPTTAMKRPAHLEGLSKERAAARIAIDRIVRDEDQPRTEFDAEDLARLALRRRLVAAAELRTLEQHVCELQHKEQTLALDEQRLATQLEAFEARVKLIAASYSAAEAQVRIGDAFDGVSTEMSDLSRALAQVEQQAVDRFRIRVVPQPHYGPPAERFVTDRLRRGFDAQAEVCFERVERIDRLASGKMQLIVGMRSAEH